MNDVFFNKLLNYYGITKEEYFLLNKEVSPDSFALGHEFDHINDACFFLKQEMSNNAKIKVYGDYDADGIMGTSILVKMFSYLSYHVDFYIPSRYSDGYGINLKQAEKAVEDGYNLIICVDNGIAALEPISYLKEHNVKVMVLDHHERLEVLPNADYILHPTISNFGKTPSSGAFVAFNFSRAMLGRFDKYLSTLASISLISDMMPLRDYNRDLMRIVINNYKDGEFFQIDALKEGDPFDDNTIGMRISPKINAIGRLVEDSSINNLVNFFVEDSKDNLLNYISWITEIYETRKAASKNEAEKINNIGKNEESLIVVTEAKEGILGLIANTLLGKFHCPVIVLTLDQSGDNYKGSARAPEGFSIADAFQKLSHLLVAGGGHAQAGGLTVKKDNLEEFSKEFNQIVKDNPVEYVEKPSIDMSLSELSLDNYQLVQSFAPFGETWQAPVFKIKNVPTKNLSFSRTGEHIITNLGFNSKITGFGYSRDNVLQYSYVDLLGKLRLNIYNGKTSVEFLLSDLKESN